MHVKRIKSNIKGGVDAELGEKTLIVGANGHGKSAIVNAVELALGGSASDIVGRAEVKREADLLSLTDGDSLEATATLSDGSTASWKTERNRTGGAKKATHNSPVEALFPVREVREALGGSADTARSWLLSKVVRDVSREDVSAWFTPEVLELYETMAGQAGPDEIGTLLRVVRQAGKDGRAKKRELEACQGVLDKLGRELGAEPTAADLERAKAESDAALEDYEAAMKASGRRDAIAVAAETKAQAERLIEVYVRRRRDWEEAQAVSPPGPELGESEARMADRLHTLAEANRIHEEIEGTNCLVCESPGPFGHRGLRARKEAAGNALSQRDNWWSVRHEIEAQMAHAQEQAEQAIEAHCEAHAAAEAIRSSGTSHGEAKAIWEGKHMAYVALQSAAGQWDNLRGHKDTIRLLKADAASLAEIVDAGKQAVTRLLKTAVQRFESAVQAHLPSADVFRLVLEDDGKEVCRFGLDRDGALHTALSGAEWARLTLAMACAASGEAGDVRVFTPEERAFDPATLREVMAALSDAPGQVILTSPIRYKGRQPKGWVVLELDAEPTPVLADSTQNGEPASLA